MWCAARGAVLGVTGFTFLACAPPSVAIGDAAAPAPPSAGPTYAQRHCEPGTSLVYRRPLDADAELTVTFTCRGDHIEAVSTATIHQGLVCYGDGGCEGGDEEPSVVEGRLDVPRFKQLRALVAAEIADGACQPTERDTRTMIAFGTGKYRIDCRYEPRRWGPVVVELEATLKETFVVVDPRDLPEEPPATDAWPFDGEYWRDELGYFRRGD